VVELEHVLSQNPEDGAIVTPLSSIQSKVMAYTWDSPKERSFFIEEGFATFDCEYKIEDNNVDLLMVSQVAWMDHYAWAFFGGWNVLVAKGEVQRRNNLGGQAYVSQHFRMSLEEGVDSGYVQMICIPNQIVCSGEFYNQFDIITFHLYRNRKTRCKVAHPGILLLRPVLNTYVPMIPGQHLQLVVNEESAVDSEVKELKDVARTFSLNKQKMKSMTYVREKLEKTDPIFINKGHWYSNVYLCGVEKRDQGYFIKVSEPEGNTVVYTQDLDGFEIALPDDDEDWVWDDSILEVDKNKDSMIAVFKKPISSIVMQRDCGHWWLSENSKAIVGTL
jgi:hypothetical protein